jgi:putative spermidine/putrescine transport system ATP-binding protein
MSDHGGDSRGFRGSALSVNAVSRGFAGSPVVRNVSLSVRSGSFATILGPSGCGKTTLLRLIAGLLEPDHGTIQLDGRDMARVPPYRRDIGVVFQRLALFPHMTAAANIAYPLRMRGVARPEIAARVADALRLVRLDGLGDRRPHALSGGQQQRVAIARALVFRPGLLLLDEPLAALDRNLREEMQGEFKRIQAETGVTAINVTHDQGEALRLSDQVLVMEAGRIVQDAPPRAVWSDPATLFVARFLGSPNLLPGSLAGGRGDQTAVLRPDAVTLGAAATACAHTVRGRVDDVDFEGATCLVTIAIPALDNIVIRARTADTALSPGETVTVGWNAGDIRLYPSQTQAEGTAA